LSLLDLDLTLSGFGFSADFLSLSRSFEEADLSDVKAEVAGVFSLSSFEFLLFLLFSLLDDFIGTLS
jgi:hypothetical protein